MKLRCPELFCIVLPSENSRIYNLQAQWMLPDRDQFGQKVYIIRVGMLIENNLEMGNNRHRNHSGL